MATPKKEDTKVPTFADKLNEIEAMIPAAFLSGNETEVKKVQAIIVKAMKALSQLRKTFDDAVDGKEMFGVDAFPNIERIRAKSENVGRPKKVKEEDTTLDF